MGDKEASQVAGEPAGESIQSSENETRRLTWYKKLSFTSGHFMNVVGISIWFPYSVIFFQKVIGLPPSDTGTVILVAQVAGAVSLPFIGMWSDQTVLRYGRRKIFHLAGILATGLVLFFLWHECLGCSDAPPEYQVIYFTSFAVVFQFGWAATQIAQLSLIPELVRDKTEQVGLNAMRTTFTIVANIIIFVCFLVLFATFKNDTNSISPDDKDVFWIVAIIAVVLGFLFGVPFQILIREDPDAARLPRLKWFEWIQQPQFFLAMCGFVSARIIFIVPQTYLPIYLTDTLQLNKKSVATGPLVLYVTAFVTTFAVKQVTKKMGTLMMFFMGMAVVWAAVIWFWVKEPSQVSPQVVFNAARDNVYLAIVLLGVGGATVLVLSYTMISQVVGKYTQFAPQSTTDPSSQEFYRHVMVYTPFAASALGLFTLSAYLLLQERERRRYNMAMSRDRLPPLPRLITTKGRAVLKSQHPSKLGSATHERRAAPLSTQLT
ncbi:Major facilitator superfamily domain-containing protein 12 [Geodia barretti]|uniref:Major facilitator superfamily domain-containing protein 12 n=1 Tax=Geodia barretti TaxID=519541 RepID=A0AA35QXA5_GEOBA|nr:Major facilitator superfamily domain-containing protein 12 [Geodia barretti]